MKKVLVLLTVLFFGTNKIQPSDYAALFAEKALESAAIITVKAILANVSRLTENTYHNVSERITNIFSPTRRAQIYHSGSTLSSEAHEIIPPKHKILDLVTAARRGLIETVKIHLATGADINAYDENGYTALMDAVFYARNTEMVHFLLLHNANPNLHHRTSGETALIKASLHGNSDAISLLLLAGANPNTINNKNLKTPLMYARNQNVITLLLAKGAQIDAQCKYKETALMYASQKGYDQCVISLIANGANINIRNAHNDTALVQAVTYNHPTTVIILLKAGAGKDRASYNTALESAKTPEMRQALLGIEMDKETTKITCSICLEAQEGSSIKTLPCNHIFHAVCVNRWTEEGNRNCPLCRTLVA
jgi:ankyrin repeat protein